jgi:Domain of unknown function (DUF4124)
MKNSNLNLGLWSVCLSFLFVITPCAAQIYKWIDANGVTHYAASKEEAGRAQAAEVSVKAQGPSEEESKAARQYWEDKDKGFNQRQAQKKLTEKPVAPAPAVAKAPKSLSGGIDDGTDASKCNFARDVLSGALKHRSGAPTTDKDRKVAENDIRFFCH